MNIVKRWSSFNINLLGMSWPLVVALTVCIGLLSYTTSQTLTDPDTHLHLATGYWIFQHQAVPSVDPFSYTRGGSPWIAHEWLAQWLLAAAHQTGGWTGLVLLTLSTFALTLAYLLRFLLSRMPPIYALLFTALASSVLVTHLLARPHVLAWPMLAVWLGSLVTASEQNRSPPWWLLGLMVLWANLHGSFTLGLALVLPIALEVVLNSPRASRGKAMRTWGGILLPFRAGSHGHAGGLERPLVYLSRFQSEIFERHCRMDACQFQRLQSP